MKFMDSAGMPGGVHIQGQGSRFVITRSVTRRTPAKKITKVGVGRKQQKSYSKLYTDNGGTRVHCSLRLGSHSSHQQHPSTSYTLPAEQQSTKRPMQRLGSKRRAPEHKHNFDISQKTLFHFDFSSTGSNFQCLENMQTKSREKWTLVVV
jgi:hypothetical protein